MFVFDSEIALGVKDECHDMLHVLELKNAFERCRLCSVECVVSVSYDFYSQGYVQPLLNGSKTCKNRNSKLRSTNLVVV